MGHLNDEMEVTTNNLPVYNTTHIMNNIEKIHVWPLQIHDCLEGQKNLHFDDENLLTIL